MTYVPNPACQGLLLTRLRRVASQPDPWALIAARFVWPVGVGVLNTPRKLQQLELVISTMWLASHVVSAPLSPCLCPRSNNFVRFDIKTLLDRTQPQPGSLLTHLP